jgi:hypothetical protein
MVNHDTSVLLEYSSLVVEADPVKPNLKAQLPLFDLDLYQLVVCKLDNAY